MSKKKRLGFAVIIMLLIVMVSIGAGFAAIAEEPIDEPAPAEETVIPDTEDKFSITEFFKVNILPYIISVAGGAGAFLIALFPFIKTKGALTQLRTQYTMSKNEVQEYKEKLQSLAQIDYKEIIAQSVGGFIESLKSEIEAKFKSLDSRTAEDLAEHQLISEKLDKVIAAASIAWSEAEGAISILAESPSATVMKQALLMTEKLKEQIRETKGEEADKLIAGLEAEVKEAV